MTLSQGLYAKCAKADKAKISKCIVQAVRRLGGRFLELDEASGAYFDIGDKKACYKTSQALREGQTKIRKQLMFGGGDDTSYDTSLLEPYTDMMGKTIPVPEGVYLSYSCQVLRSLRNSNDYEPIHYEPTAMPQLAHPDSRGIVSPSPSIASEGSYEDLSPIPSPAPGIPFEAV